MLLFLYGKDNYRLKQKLKAIKDKYLGLSNTEVNFSIISAEDGINFEKIKSDIEAMPFLAQKRLIILRNFLSQASSEVQNKLIPYLEKIPETSIVVLVEENVPDKKTELFRIAKSKASRVWEFNLLKPYELENWIKTEIKKRGTKIESQAVKLLASYVGPDLWQMQNEITKLVLYTKGEIIKESDVELLVKAKLDDNIFSLIDALGNKNISRAIQKLEDLLKSGMPEVYILSMIIYQFRNILIVKDLLQRQTKKEALGEKTKMHPFVLQKTLKQSRNFTLKQLKVIYRQLARMDLAIKTGKIEPKIALNLLLVELVK